MGKLKIQLAPELIELMTGWKANGKTLSYISTKLEQEFGIKASRETVRRILKENGVDTSNVKTETAQEKYQTGYEFDGENGKFNYNVDPADEEEYDEFAGCGDGDIISKVLTKFGFNPEEFELVGNLRVVRWQQNLRGEFKASYRFNVTKKLTPAEQAEEFNLPTMFAEASKKLELRKAYAAPEKQRALIVPWADLQAGKQDKLGGTEALMDRIAEKQEKLKDYIKEQNTTIAYLLDAGDSIEGFENTAGQAHTNTLSLMDQIDLVATFETQMIQILAATHNEVGVVGIDSNHCKWRAGKGVLGKPGDDWGRFINRQLKKAFDLNPEAYGHVWFNEPDKWERTINIDILGTGVGLAHGDQVNNPDAIPKWWAGQTHGNQPIAMSELLITGHFHHFLMRPTGRHLITDRQKWHFQMPTLDNGSSWYAHQSGESSDPGLVVFVIEEDTGFSLQSLNII
jgi:hypothetical protein